MKTFIEIEAENLQLKEIVSSQLSDINRLNAACDIMAQEINDLQVTIKELNEKIMSKGKSKKRKTQEAI